MIASLLEFSLRQRILVLSLACLLSLVGVFAFQSIPIDAYPDVTNIQVQVLTDAPGSVITLERLAAGYRPRPKPVQAAPVEPAPKPVRQQAPQEAPANASIVGFTGDGRTVTRWRPKRTVQEAAG